MTSLAQTSALEDVPLRLFDPRRGDSSLRVEPMAKGAFRQPERFNYFTVLVLRNGRANFHVDLQKYGFDSPVLLFANPYQIFFLEAGSAIEGVSLQFHANFFCIETYHEEVGCNGVLFNDIYGQPLVRLDATHSAAIEKLVAEMKDEMRSAGFGSFGVAGFLFESFPDQGYPSQAGATKMCAEINDQPAAHA
jgi:AraC family transcriptional regulator, transcriptional activator of pobA